MMSGSLFALYAGLLLVPDVAAPKRYTAGEVYQTYRWNDARADELFTGRMIEVTGQPSAVERTAGGRSYRVWVPSAAEPAQGLEFDCEAADRPVLAALDMPTQTVTLRGVCAGRVGTQDGPFRIRFERCRVVLAHRTAPVAFEFQLIREAPGGKKILAERKVVGNLGDCQEKIMSGDVKPGTLSDIQPTDFVDPGLACLLRAEEVAVGTLQIVMFTAGLTAFTPPARVRYGEWVDHPLPDRPGRTGQRLRVRILPHDGPATEPGSAAGPPGTR